MKRKIAQKKLKRKCDQCRAEFKKGDIYYIDRIVHADEYGVAAFEQTYCPKCRYKNKDRKERYDLFIKSGTCKHPIIDEVWSYIPGEAVMQPDHYECLICGEWL